mmetsp:Transcript_22684/g.49240  ORF Transcript_22684/g.49240 Transcript_22684/m.49240 type:complete len:92 (+) Transcript_22684:736-1011(+)
MAFAASANDGDISDEGAHAGKTAVVAAPNEMLAASRTKDRRLFSLDVRVHVAVDLSRSNASAADSNGHAIAKTDTTSMRLIATMVGVGGYR